MKANKLIKEFETTYKNAKVLETYSEGYEGLDDLFLMCLEDMSADNRMLLGSIVDCILDIIEDMLSAQSRINSEVENRAKKTK